MLIYYAVEHAPENRTGVVISILADRLLGLAGLTLWVIVIVPFLPCHPEATGVATAVGWLAGAAAVGFGVALYFLFTPAGSRWSRRFPVSFQEGMGRVQEVVRMHRDQPRPLVSALALAAAIPLVIVAAGWCLGKAQGLVMSYRTLLGVLPLVLLISSVPVSIGGLGTREAVVALFFPVFALVEPTAAATAVAFSLLWYLLTLLWGTIGGLIYIATTRTGARRQSYRPTDDS